MSDASQVQSTQLQVEFLRRYASEHGMHLVKVYADEGRSGLGTEGRSGFLQLIADLAAGSAGFDVLLVYDVSRWGRFQNVDQSGYYEFLCQKAGVHVVYCAEPFINDGSPPAQLMKSIKRSMAAEYSRELSAKVFSGQRRLALLGFKQGGAATYGMRRVAVSEDGGVVRYLEQGERKPRASDRVRLVPGPADELRIVRRIFNMYNHQGKTVSAIARQLNDEAVRCGDHRWTDYRVHSVLSKSQYWGCQSYNRTCTKLHSRLVRNPAQQWICVDNAIPAVVSPAEGALAERTRRMRNGDEQPAVLDAIRQVFAEYGRVSYALLSCVPGMPGKLRLMRMFGTLAAACEAAGIGYPRMHELSVAPHFLVMLRNDLRDEVMALIRRVGGEVAPVSGTVNRLWLNQQFVLRLSVLCCRCSARRLQWRLLVHGTPPTDFILAALLNAGNEFIDRYALIATAREPRPVIYFGRGWDANSRDFVHPDLESIFGL